jgi:hypothetical protein
LRTYVFREDTVHEHLISLLAARGLFSQLSQGVWIDADRDQLACLPADRWATDATHHTQLFVRSFGDIRKINLWLWRTPLVLYGSRAARWRHRD